MKENPKKSITILAVGGLDPTGSAGVLMDARAAGAAGVNAAVCVTTHTIQDNERFFASNPVDPIDVKKTLDTLLETLPIGAVKVGALSRVATVEVLADLAEEDSFPPLVVDPVIASTSGGILLEKEGAEVLVERLLPAATLLTPNLGEASLISGQAVESVDDMESAAKRFVELGARAVLVKGGHLDSDGVVDLYLDRSGNQKIFKTDREGSFEVRGTGCALASLIAAFIARDCDLLESIEEARKILVRAIRNSVQVAPGPRMLNFD